MSGARVEIAQVNAVDVDEVLSRQAELETGLQNIISAKRLDLFLFVVTDILNGDSVVVALGPRASAVESAYGVTLENNRARLTGCRVAQAADRPGADGHLQQGLKNSAVQSRVREPSAEQFRQPACASATQLCGNRSGRRGGWRSRVPGGVSIRPKLPAGEHARCKRSPGRLTACATEGGPVSQRGARSGYHFPSATASGLTPPSAITAVESTGTNGSSSAPSFLPTLSTLARISDAARS